MKNTKQPEPRLTELRLRKEIATLLNTTRTLHLEGLSNNEAYCMLEDGIWALLKKREPKEVKNESQND